MTKGTTNDRNKPGNNHDIASGGVSRRSFVAGATTAAGAMTLAQSSTRAMAQAAKPKAFWPNGARLAIAFSMVIETGADPDPTTKGPDGKNYPDLYAKTAEQYATREAIPRMLDMFDRRRIKVTVHDVRAQSCERHPALTKEIAQRGHECGSHGRSHDIQYQLSRDDERSFIQGSADMIEQATGQRPVGYNCRGQLAQRQHALDWRRSWDLSITSTTSAAMSPSSSRSTTSRSRSCPIPRTSTTSAISTIVVLPPPSPRTSSWNSTRSTQMPEHKRRLMVVTLHDAVARAEQGESVRGFHHLCPAPARRLVRTRRRARKMGIGEP